MIRVVGERCLECMHLATSSAWGHCPSCGCPNHSSGPPHAVSQRHSPSVRGGPDALVTIAVIAGFVLAYLFVVLSW